MFRQLGMKNPQNVLDIIVLAENVLQRQEKHVD